jgi:hypothetical protein
LRFILTHHSLLLNQHLKSQYRKREKRSSRRFNYA